MPNANNGAFDNVLEDKDPAICFVKAYARKPLGVPIKKSGQATNAMDRDWEDDWYDDDEYDNYGEYDDFSDSEDYYDEEGDSSEEDEDSSEDDSSEEDSDANEFDAYDFNAWADHKGGH
jgi:hypothetical protein